MDDYGRFLEWFTSWKNARPFGMTPVGWYTVADVEAAFHSGISAERQRGLDELLTRTKALEDLLRGGIDDRPGSPSSTQAGPVPE